jgi:hypothetical protein
MKKHKGKGFMKKGRESKAARKRAAKRARK